MDTHRYTLAPCAPHSTHAHPPPSSGTRPAPPHPRVARASPINSRPRPWARAGPTGSQAPPLRRRLLPAPPPRTRVPQPRPRAMERNPLAPSSHLKKGKQHATISRGRKGKPPTPRPHRSSRGTHVLLPLPTGISRGRKPSPPATADCRGAGGLWARGVGHPPGSR
eukprot:scaffold93_cov112-Isochrysis_galbana.AAC.3